ncbi:hypothetical protein [Ornithinimicrobium cavernae]|uniref:hypothetical protein n=1 Tax=Ornithinimicrobium cavernae TaxID=2666047 RepID=UPI000D6940E7|nr:hypothetical protein [Ornithinimicrobium cavernae]
MLILGLLLIAAALVVFGYMFFGTRDLEPLRVDLGIFTVELTPLHLYLLGAATLVVLVLGLLALAAGLRASRRRRREVKDLRRAVREGGLDQDRGRDRGTADRYPEPAPPAAEDSSYGGRHGDVRSRDTGAYDDTGEYGGTASYEREVPGSSPGDATGEPSPHQGQRDVALPGDYTPDADQDGPRR